MWVCVHCLAHSSYTNGVNVDYIVLCMCVCGEQEHVSLGNGCQSIWLCDWFNMGSDQIESHQFYWYSFCSCTYLSIVFPSFCVLHLLFLCWIANSSEKFEQKNCSQINHLRCTECLPYTLWAQELPLTLPFTRMAIDKYMHIISHHTRIALVFTMRTKTKQWKIIYSVVFSFMIYSHVWLQWIRYSGSQLPIAIGYEHEHIKMRIIIVIDGRHYSD